MKTRKIMMLAGGVLATALELVALDVLVTRAAHSARSELQASPVQYSDPIQVLPTIRVTPDPADVQRVRQERAARVPADIADAGGSRPLGMPYYTFASRPAHVGNG